MDAFEDAAPALDSAMTSKELQRDRPSAPESYAGDK
jgi:hypothetical protein